jgi:hypothetical protein
MLMAFQPGAVDSRVSCTGLFIGFLGFALPAAASHSCWLSACRCLYRPLDRVPTTTSRGEQQLRLL